MIKMARVSYRVCPACKLDRDPREDICLKCGKCGRCFNSTGILLKSTSVRSITKRIRRLFFGKH